MERDYIRSGTSDKRPRMIRLLKALARDSSTLMSEVYFDLSEWNSPEDLSQSLNRLARELDAYN